MKMLLKNLVFAIVPAMVFACSVRADDNDFMSELANVDSLAIADADINVEDFDLGDLDVDKLADAAGENEDQAVEACFRRFGYSSYSHHYYPSYSHHHHYYPRYTYYRPLYRHHTYYTSYHTPVYYHNYWGCY